MLKRYFSSSRIMSKSLKDIALASNFKPASRLGDKDLNPHTLVAKYAVRGKIPTMAEQLKGTLQSDPDALPFDKIIFSNIGNPQQLGQKPITFYRQVLSLIEYPDLLENEKAKEIFPQDAMHGPSKRNNAKFVLCGCIFSFQGCQVFQRYRC